MANVGLRDFNSLAIAVGAKSTKFKTLRNIFSKKKTEQPRHVRNSGESGSSKNPLVSHHVPRENDAIFSVFSHLKLIAGGDPLPLLAEEEGPGRWIPWIPSAFSPLEKTHVANWKITSFMR